MMLRDVARPPEKSGADIDVDVAPVSQRISKHSCHCRCNVDSPLLLSHPSLSITLAMNVSCVLTEGEIQLKAAACV